MEVELFVIAFKEEYREEYYCKLGAEYMKHGIKLKRKHKEFLSSVQLDPREYLLERQTSYEYRFINIKTGKVEKFSLEG